MKVEIPADASSVAFQDLVTADAKGAGTDEAARWLRSPEVLDIWILCLCDLQASIEGQFARACEEEAADELAEFNGKLSEEALLRQKLERAEWRRKAGRMERGLKVRMMEATLLLNHRNTDRLVAVIKEYLGDDND
jgi:hypothetical protein